MIDPGGIPQYTGDFGNLDKAVSDLRTRASGIRDSGQNVHSRFQATAAYYKAPEAEQLFSSTQPVMDTADEFATDIEALADALDTFAAEAKPHADRLKQLKSDAIDFVNSVAGDGHWTQDQAKVDKHQALMDGVAAAVEGFQEAERNAANKINAISPGVCRPSWVEDDGSHAMGMYGVSASVLKDAKDLPWGSPEGRTYERWSLGWWGHGVKSWAWDGIAKDSIWGGFVGLGTLEDNLLGVNGSDAQDQTWDGLRRTAVGGYAYGMDVAGQGDHLSDWQRGSEAYTKEFGKQFVAYDMWDQDPARAHAVASFNILTMVAGAGGVLAKLGKAGRFAETASAVAKVGDVLDPISGGMKAARAVSNLPKVSEVLSHLSDRLRLPPTKFPDAVLDLNDRYRVGKDGQLIPINADGTPHLAEAPHEPAAADRIPSLHHGDREPVGVGGHAPEATARAGDHMPSQGDHGTTATGGGGPDSPHGGHEHSGGSGGGHAADDGRGGQHPGGHHDTGHGAADGHNGDGAPDSTNAGHGPGVGTGDHTPAADGPPPDGQGQPMVRGGEAEQRIRDAIKGIPGGQRPKPNVMERVLDRLASEPDGQRVADIIASGHFNRSDEYGQVVSAMGAKREQMFQPAADQLIFADDLVRSGVPAHTIDFEQKIPAGADMDVRIKDESGDVYAYQLKHLNKPQDPVSEITRGHYLLQLASAQADHAVMLVDGGRGTIAEWMSNGSYDELMAVNGGARGRKGMGITFVVRLEDGNLVIPPGSKTDPKDML